MKNNIKRRDFIKKAGVAGVGVAALEELQLSIEFVKPLNCGWTPRMDFSFSFW